MSPPTSGDNYFIHLIAYLKDFAAHEESFIIVGDFNFPDICWDSLSGATFCSKLLCDFVFEYNLLQQIDCPTRVKGNTLDILLTNIYWTSAI